MGLLICGPGMIGSHFTHLTETCPDFTPIHAEYLLARRPDLSDEQVRGEVASCKSAYHFAMAVMEGPPTPGMFGRVNNSV